MAVSKTDNSEDEAICSAEDLETVPDASMGKVNLKKKEENEEDIENGPMVTADGMAGGTEMNPDAMTSASSKPPMTKDAFDVNNLPLEKKRLVFQLWKRVLDLLALSPEEQERELALHMPISSSTMSIGAEEGESLEIKVAVPSLSGQDDDPSRLADEFWFYFSVEDHDATMIRFLQSRRWEVPAAYDMLVKMLQWRVSRKIREIALQGELGLPLEILETEEYWVRGRDHCGRPIAWAFCNRHSKKISTFKMRFRYAMLWAETVRRYLGPTSRTITAVFDLQGFSIMKNMEHTMVKQLISCFQSNCPEVLGMAIIVNAPWMFSTIWSVVSPWLDPVVTSKIRFAKASDLHLYIDRKYIPKRLGGKDRDARFEGKPNALPERDEALYPIQIAAIAAGCSALERATREMHTLLSQTVSSSPARQPSSQPPSSMPQPESDSCSECESRPVSPYQSPQPTESSCSSESESLARLTLSSSSVSQCQNSTSDEPWSVTSGRSPSTYSTPLRSGISPRARSVPQSPAHSYMSNDDGDEEEGDGAALEPASVCFEARLNRQMRKRHRIKRAVVHAAGELMVQLHCSTVFERKGLIHRMTQHDIDESPGDLDEGDALDQEVILASALEADKEIIIDSGSHRFSGILRAPMPNPSVQSFGLSVAHDVATDITADLEEYEGGETAVDLSAYADEGITDYATGDELTDIPLESEMDAGITSKN